jgi:hypothetical protein
MVKEMVKGGIAKRNLVHHPDELAGAFSSAFEGPI